MRRSLSVILWLMTALTVTLVLIETVSGMVLMHCYRIGEEVNYNDILTLREDPVLGICRELHLRMSGLLSLSLFITLPLAGIVFVLKRKTSSAG